MSSKNEQSSSSARKGEIRRAVNKANVDAKKPGRVLAEDGSLVGKNFYNGGANSLEQTRAVNKANADAGLPGRIAQPNGMIDSPSGWDAIWASKIATDQLLQYLADTTSEQERGSIRDRRNAFGYPDVAITPQRAASDKIAAMKAYLQEDKRIR